MIVPKTWLNPSKDIEVISNRHDNWYKPLPRISPFTLLTASLSPSTRPAISFVSGGGELRDEQLPLRRVLLCSPVLVWVRVPVVQDRLLQWDHL